MKKGTLSCLARILISSALASSPALAQQPAIGIAPVALGDGPYRFDTAEQHGIRVDVVVRGLSHPFSLAFLPNGDALVTERGTRLRLVKNAASTLPATLVPEPVAGTPTLAPVRGGGLHEVAVHPAFATNGLVYLTYNRAGTPLPNPAPDARPPTTIVLASARFDGQRLVDFKELMVGGERPGASGSRLAFTPDGFLLMSTGAPFTAEAADPGNVYGKVLRLRPDGSVPTDNPFVSRPGARPEVFSIGHRDQLGLTVLPNGTILSMEYGPNGGDEVNVVLPGRDYGWPRSSYGRTYEGPRVSAMPLEAGVEQPLLVWLPSIAPTGMVLYTGDRLASWKGNLFVGSGRRGGIPRTGSLERIVFNSQFEELRRESLLSELHQRIRDVRQGPDGLLYVLTDEDDGALLRISPSP
jgi:glucose/arabinose dehydrogenase